MNQDQVGRYGRLTTYTDILRRHCDCQVDGCGFHVSAARRGPGANALATAARLKGQVMTHMRVAHPDVKGWEDLFPDQVNKKS